MPTITDISPILMFIERNQVLTISIVAFAVIGSALYVVYQALRVLNRERCKRCTDD